jgi:two-component sensor histidine kinase/PAS domain-containing protein
MAGEPQNGPAAGLTSSATDLRDLFKNVLDAVIELQGADFGILQLYDRDSGAPRLLAQRGFEPATLGHLAGESADGSICGAAFDGDARVIVEDVTSDPRCQAMRPLAAAAGFRALQSTPLRGRAGERLGVLATHFRHPHRPSDRDLRLTDLFALQAGDIITSRFHEDALRSSEARLQFALDAAHMGTWSWEPASDVALADARTLAILGEPGETTFSLARTPEERLHPDDIVPYRAAVEAALDPRGNGALHVEFRWIRRDGSQLWLLQCGLTQFEGEGAQRRGVRMTGTVMDITDRKVAEERQSLLAREIDHRAKNLLATIQAMISLSARSHTALEDFVTATQNRIVSLAKAHDLMAVTHWEGAGLRQLVEHELRAYASNKEQVATIEGDRVVLKPSAATALSMVIHELATNAAKYGALSVPDGRVSCRWKCTHDGTLALQWQESGGPLVEPPKRKGFGSLLVLKTLEHELGGHAHTDFAREGVRCSITLPADQIALR